MSKASPALQEYDALPAASDWPADDVPAFSEQPADDVSALPEQADVSDDFDAIDKHQRFKTCFSAPRQTSINEVQVADAFSFHLLVVRSVRELGGESFILLNFYELLSSGRRLR